MVDLVERGLRLSDQHSQGSAESSTGPWLAGIPAAGKGSPTPP